METENKELFNKEESTEQPESTEQSETTQLETEGLQEATLSDKSPQQIEEENGVRQKSDGKVLTIKEWGFTNPIIKDREGNTVEPKESNNGSSKFYSIKLKIRYDEDNIVEYYPSINQFVNNGQLSPSVTIYRDGNSKVSQLFRMAICHMSKGKFELITKKINDRPCLVIDEKSLKDYKAYEKTFSDKEVLNYLIGKQVKIEVAEGVYEGNSWFRNDIVEIL